MCCSTEHRFLGNPKLASPYPVEPLRPRLQRMTLGEIRRYATSYWRIAARIRPAERDGTRRMARRAFCAYAHDAEKCHGFPVGWKEVPEQLRRDWRVTGVVKHADVRRFWESSEESL